LPPKEKLPTAHLLPNYDEYFIGFKDRSAIGDVIRQSNLDPNNPAFIAHVILIDGQIVGGWKRALKREVVIIELSLITDLARVEKQAVAEAADRYGKFLGLPVQLINVA
jgi:winged helix DNA-binding protein